MRKKAELQRKRREFPRLPGFESAGLVVILLGLLEGSLQIILFAGS